MKNRIREIRESEGLSQSKFAAEIGLTKNYVSLLENGQRNLSEQSITILCDKYHVNREWLKNGIGNMHEEYSEYDKIAGFMGDLLRDTPDVRHKLISVLADLNDDEWTMIERIIERLVEEQKK